ncbi:MAG TPA: hypothetical protein PJ986_06040 [Gammaproteobacteria bacterium]|nr:hypothetical protein [Gammaproteobacteria bacterium]
MNNRDTLIELMVTHGLERRELAALLRVDRDTVDRWLLPREAARGCEVPDMAIELLGYKLREREAQGG